MSNTRVAGASSALPAHSRQEAGRASAHTLPSAPALAPPRFVSKPHSHQHRANPLRLASVHAAEHEAFFSRGRHPPPPMSIVCCSAYADKSLVGEDTNLRNKEREAIIKKQLQDPEFSPSPYDTAWVAMVPLRGFHQTPCFPQCVEWILQKQRDDGSWGISELVLPTSKSTLLSTLACVVALKKWDVGAEHIRRGLHFIGRNFSIAMDERISAPIGFNITFPGMVSLAMGMGLELPLRQKDLDAILHIQQMELKSFSEDKSYGRETYMAYVAEGLGNLLDWNEVMKFQRKNGSLFNSPSTTAAALIYYYNDKAFQYLKSLLSKFGSAAPAVYPINISCQLLMVDSLEKIGISRHFSSEIKSILDMTHSLWLQRDEEIMLDVATCAMAFRILRMNGYDVSSGELYHVAEAANFHNSLQGYLHDTKSLLELYKASNASISKTEMILDNIGAWSGSLLMEQLCSYGAQKVPIFEEVEYALKFPFYATMERLEHKSNIETFDVQGYQMLKTEYLPCRVNKDLLALAVEDFTFSQSIYQDELLHIESWVKGNRWDEHHRLKFHSERVQIVFRAIYATVNQLAAMASAAQNRDVRKHLIEVWIYTLKSMMTEAEWTRVQYVPTIDEYMTNAKFSYALGPIVLPSLYFLGQELSMCVVEDQEYDELFSLMSTCCRLLNDIQGFEREGNQGKVNSVSLYVIDSGGSLSTEAAKKAIHESIALRRRDLLRLVLREDRVVPRPCKELFWKMCKINHLFYSQTDGYSSPKEMISTVNAVIYEPLKLQISDPSLLLKRINKDFVNDHVISSEENKKGSGIV
ncbi:hypothetical protein ACQ4PT_056464 [Festuca glaucescens]